MICVKCGNALTERDKFCSQCGEWMGQAKERAFYKWYHPITVTFYALAILTCFICNLAIEGALSWFYIVLASIILSFSITNIPLIAKKFKLITSVICASVMVYVLLFVCSWYAKGDWLFSFAYPIASISLLFLWGIILISAFLHTQWQLKSALIVFTVGIFSMIITPLCSHLMGEPVIFYDYIRLDYWSLEIAGNKATFLCCMLYCVVVFAITLLRKRIKRMPEGGKE